VTDRQRTEAGTPWPEIFAVSERVELRSKLGGRRGMQANA